MGRVARSGGGSAERAKTIGKPRTKRRKRRDLEELRRNALGAKRNLHARAAPNKKRTTALGKVVSHFADTRQANEDTNHSSADKQGGKKNSRTVCNRLLPEQIFGIYQNGTKGQELRRANRDFNKIKAARLEGDVLMLLNGDETKLKRYMILNFDRSSRNGDEKPSDESGSADTVVLGKTKRVNGVKGEKKRMNLIAKNTLTDAKNEQLQLLQRENNHKRRLFEPNEDDSTDSCYLGNTAVPMDLSSNETRFPSSRDIARDVSVPKNCFRNKEPVEPAEVETRRKATKKLMPIDGETIDANVWGWSPATYYETLCAKISVENFENNQTEEPRGRDPVVKIRRALRDFYRNTSRRRGSNRKAVIVKGNKRREENLPKVSFPLEDPSFSSTTEIQACTADFEADQETSDSDASKVGSWRPRRFGGIYDWKDRSATTDTNETTLKWGNHNKQDKLKRDKQSREDRTNGVEKTIHEVSAFLERLREDKSANEKGSIFEEEVARFSQKEERVTSDANPRNCTQRNTKHVPTILRRSNGRFNFAEGPNVKQPSSNWPVNGMKRSARTICGLPPRSSRENENFDEIPTPSIVAFCAMFKKPKPNVRKSVLNVTEAKCRLDARSSSSEHREVDEVAERDDKNAANKRESSASGVFISPTSIDDREWCHSECTEPTLESRAEEARKNTLLKILECRKVDLGKKNDIPDFYESNRRTNATNFSEFHDYQLSDPCRQENPRYSSFQFVRSDDSKTSDSRDRRSFAEKMGDVRLRCSREASRDYLREREKRDATRETRLSDVGPSASQHFDIQLPPEGCVERAPADNTRNRSFQPLPSYHADALSHDRPPVNEASGTKLQRIRKPVMLFRPIQETRQRQETRDSRYRPSENAEATINDAVTNFRVLTFDENSRGRSSPQRRCSQVCHVLCQPPQQQRQSQSQSHFDDDTAVKYRAVEAPNGSNPRRLPVYIKSDANRVTYAVTDRYDCQVKPPIVSNGIARPETSEIMYLSSRGGSDRGTQNAGKVQYHGKEQRVKDPWSAQANQVTLVLPYSAPFYQQPTSLLPMTAAGSSRGSSNVTDASHMEIKGPRLLYSLASGETAVPMEIQLQPSSCSQSRYDGEKLTKRIQLPDGRIGIIVTDSRAMDNPERLSDVCGPTLTVNGIDVGDLDERNRPGLTNETIYY